MYANLTLNGNTVNLTEESHKAVIVAMLAVMTSPIIGGDSKKSGEIILEALKGMPTDNLTVEAGDNAKIVKNFSGATLISLATLFSTCEASVDWLGNRGGNKGNKAKDVPTLASLFPVASPVAEKAGKK